MLGSDRRSEAPSPLGRLRKALVASGSVRLLCCAVWHRLLPNKVPSGMKEEDWTLLSVVRLSLAKNIAFNVVNEKTTFGLLKALPNMYKKPSASNKFNSVISKLLSIAIKFDDEMHALSLLSSLPDSWFGTVTAVSCTLVRRVMRGRVIGVDWDQERSHPRRTLGTSRFRTVGKKGTLEVSVKGAVNVFANVFDDALLYCIEEYCESWVMNSGASFHATSCMGMMKNFKPLLGKYRVDSKDVRYIPTLERKLISVGQMDNKEDVDREAEKKNAISERLCGRLCRQLKQREKSTCEPLRLDLVSPGVLLIIVESLGTSKGLGTKGCVKASGSLGASGSSVNRLSLYVCTDLAMVEMSSLGENQTWFLGQVTSRKAKVKRCMYKDVKAFLHVNFDKLRKALIASGSLCLLCCGVWHRLLPNKQLVLNCVVIDSDLMDIV
nr:retrovirus-related Pol polyprotein from transposon TNT 1-94 [Tanacetum cinerariifolium]